MLRGLERREREPWRALSVFEPSNINFSVFNANPSILFIPFDFFNVTFNINRSNNLNNNLVLTSCRGISNYGGVATHCLDETKV